MEYFNQIDSFPLSKAVVLPSGFIRFVAPIARATKQGEKGFLNISKKDGKPYYQTVSKELLQKTKKSFSSIPATLFHPPEMVNSSNSHKYVKGLTGSSEDSIIQIDNYQFATGTIWDSELIAAIKTQAARQISPGYSITLRHKQDDIFEQADRVGNHLGFVPMGRQGSSVALQLDESDILWDYASEFQCDAEELADIKREILGLPESFLDLSYSSDVINLDQISFEQKDKKDMPNLMLVTDNGLVVKVESEQQDQLDNLSAYVARLKTQKDEAIVKASQVIPQTDSLEAEKTIANLQAQIEVLKLEAAKPVPQMDKSEVSTMVKGLMEIAPHILKLDPKFQLDAVDSPIELKRTYVALAMPHKAQEIQSWQFDNTPQGQVSQGKIEGFYEVLISRPQAQEQTDKTEDRDFSSAFQALLSQGSNVKTQLDETEDHLEKARSQMAKNWQ